jgi:hypothetical protein
MKGAGVGRHCARSGDRMIRHAVADFKLSLDSEFQLTIGNWQQVFRAAARAGHRPIHLRVGFGHAAAREVFPIQIRVLLGSEVVGHEIRLPVARATVKSRVVDSGKSC